LLPRTTTNAQQLCPHYVKIEMFTKRTPYIKSLWFVDTLDWSTWGASVVGYNAAGEGTVIMDAGSDIHIIKRTTIQSLDTQLKEEIRRAYEWERLNGARYDWQVYGAAESE
jgi:hypothetical protein